MVRLASYKWYTLLLTEKFRRTKIGNLKQNPRESTCQLMKGLQLRQLMKGLQLRSGEGCAVMLLQVVDR